MSDLLVRGAAVVWTGAQVFEDADVLCVDGAVAASVMGYDGIAVDTHEVDPAELARPIALPQAFVERFERTLGADLWPGRPRG